MEIRIVNGVIDYYLRDRNNIHADRRCKNPKSIAAHLVAVRREWGEWELPAFAKGAKGRIKAVVEQWRASGTAQATCRKRISFLKTAYRLAAEDEVISRDDVPNICLPANGPPRERLLDPRTELPALLRAADRIKTPPHIRLAAELSLRTGQRAGAIRALTWSEHIDFTERVIRFRDTEAPEERSKKRRLDQPMDDELHALLLRAYEDRDCDYVISWRGKRVRSTYVGMKALYRRAGLTNLHIHDLRRAAATYVHRELDGDSKAAAGFLGDTELVAARHYIQDSADTRLPQVHALSRVMARARGALP